MLTGSLQTHASKVDSIVAENPDKSLDELVAARKINADQKAQILNKPKLQESLAQLEEQISQYKKFDQEYKARLLSEKAEFEKTFTDKSAKELETSLAAAKASAEAEAVKEQHASLLLISQFLRLAAIRRGDEEADATLDENKALEGVLAKVYTGDEEAVQTMLKIIQGSEEKTVSVNSEGLSTSCKYAALLLMIRVLTRTRYRDQGSCPCTKPSRHHKRRGSRRRDYRVPRRERCYYRQCWPDRAGCSSRILPYQWTQGVF